MTPENTLAALKKESENLLQLLNNNDINTDAYPSEKITHGVQERTRLIECLKNLTTQERIRLKENFAQTLKETESLGLQCITALEKSTLTLARNQQQMTQGRQALQAYQPTTENTARFIENDV